MKKQTITDFEKGNEVYHLSNSKRRMVVIGINEETSEVTCRWLDDSGNSHKQEFFAAEIGKCSTGATFSIRAIDRSRNHY
ncbi:MAG: hypothetical protein JWP45_3589 [Mucilaginibacter sp.]|nr:hypothetical protein [Mucilaginibacter sp.]